VFSFCCSCIIFSAGSPFAGTCPQSIVAPLLSRENAEVVYIILSISRAILGVGVGGKYPLASAIRAESAERYDESHHSVVSHRAKEVARSFFWQTPGAILPYVASLLLLLIFGDEASGIGKGHERATLSQYILLVGVGAVPSLVVLVYTWRQMSIDRLSRREGSGSPQDERSQATEHEVDSRFRWSVFCSFRRRYSRIDRGDSLTSAIHNKAYWGTLMGTGLSWALYDFVYYGTAFNLPEILSRVLGEEGGLIEGAWREVLVASMGIPGVICAIWMIEPMGGPKPLQGWGFVLIGAACSMLSFFYSGANSTSLVSKWGSFVSCCLLIFALNWGVNVSSYVMPIEKFPKECRSSFHGLSAGFGKFGALIGSAAFTQLNAISVGLTFSVCVIGCAFGVLVTWRLIPPVKRHTFFLRRGSGRLGGIEPDEGERQSGEPLQIDGTVC